MLHHAETDKVRRHQFRVGKYQIYCVWVRVSAFVGEVPVRVKGFGLILAKTNRNVVQEINMRKLDTKQIPENISGNECTRVFHENHSYTHGH